MLILGKNLGEVEHVKNEMKKLHIMKNLRSISKILEIHLQAAKHVLHYLERAINLEILYKTNRESLIIFADAFYVNAHKFKLTIEFCALISNESVTWISRKQQITAQSTIKSKYI